MAGEMNAGGNSGKFFVLFLAGSAIAAGVALLMSKVRKRGLESAARTPGTYCSVPEGADICFPEE